MKKQSLFLLVIFTINCFSLFSQKSFMKFGEIPEEDMKLTVYPDDTTAEAVFLGEYGVTRFNISEDQGFYLEYEHHKRIKILKKSGLDWADFLIRTYVGTDGHKEDVQMIKAFTFNLEDGKVVKKKLERDAIFTQKESKNYEITKFTMPNVKVGSVIDVTYSIVSPYTFTLQAWYFQNTIPVRKSVYHVKIPEYYIYKNWTSGYISVNKESEMIHEVFQYTESATIDPKYGRQSGGMVKFDAQVTHWTYSAEKVPAFKNEPYITTRYDYLSAVEFELTSTNFPNGINKYYSRKWEDVNRELLADFDFGQQLNNSGHMREQVDRISSLTNDPLQKMKLAYYHISKKISWDSRYRIWPTETIRKAYNEGEGSSADINLNLIALCKALGLDANPVLISTRTNGKIRPGQVILTQFNHVAACVRIGEKKYILDAINPNCPYNILPPNSLNDKGMMISEKGYQWVDLYSTIPDKIAAYTQVTLNKDMQFEGIMQKSYDNYSALKERDIIKKETDSVEYSEKIEQNYNGLTINEINVENLDSIYLPLKVKLQITLNDKVMQGGDKIYFNPVLVNRLEENPFKNEERKYPIDYNYPNQYKSITIIDIPEGYTVEDLPQSLVLALPENGGKYVYSLSAVGNKISLNTELSINQTIFPNTNYGEIKKFYEMMVAKQAEQIVLKVVNL
jgi:hypothetical protein